MSLNTLKFRVNELHVKTRFFKNNSDNHMTKVLLKGCVPDTIFLRLILQRSE